MNLFPSNILIPEKYLNVPKVRQAKSYTCGVAATMSVLSYWEQYDTDEETLEHTLQSNDQDGTSYHNILAFLQSRGYSVIVKKGWNVPLSDLFAYVDKGIPPMICLQAYADPSPPEGGWMNDTDDGHYNVVVAYDSTNIYFMDPSALSHFSYMSISEFMQRWHDVDGPMNEPIPHFILAAWLPGQPSPPYNPKVAWYEW